MNGGKDRIDGVRKLIFVSSQNSNVDTPPPNVRVLGSEVFKR
jgi:hypothetical protein